MNFYKSRILFVLMISMCIVSGCGNGLPSKKTDNKNENPVLSFGPLYLYQTSAVVPGEIGGPAMANARCEASYHDYAPTVSCTKFVGLLIYSANKGLKDFAQNNSIHHLSPVKVFDGAEIFSSFESLAQHALDNIFPAVNYNGLGFINNYFYMGEIQDNDGIVNTDYNCQDWTSSSNVVQAVGGQIWDLGEASWNDGSIACNTSSTRPHLCLCQ